MKKLLHFAGIIACSTLVMTSCNKTPENSDKVELKLSAAATEVAPGKTLQFMVTSETALESDIIINVASDNTSAATVPATVTMKAGQQSVTDIITGVAEGEATITISADGALISEGSLKIKVSGTADTPVPEKPELVLSTEKAKLYTGETMKFTVTTAKAPEKDVTITVKSSDENIFTVTESLTLQAGKTSVEGTLTAVAVGSAKVTIEAEGIDIKTGSKDVTVEKAPALELTIAAANTTVYVGLEREFTITTPVAPSENIEITLVSSNTAAVELVNQTITLRAGQKSVTGKVKGIAEGTSQVSFTASPETPIVTSSLEFTSEILMPDIKELEADFTVGTQNTWESFGFIGGDYACGGLFYHNHPWAQQYGFDVYKTSIDTYGGNFVGTLHNGYGVFTSISEGTPIDDNLAWIEIDRGSFPSFWTDEGFSIGDGEHYVVCQLMYTYSGGPVEFRRAWIKVNVNGSEVTLIEGAMCVNEAPFAVGDK